MHGEIITIGDELISGKTLDLNARFAAGRLTASGFHVTRMTSVGDDPEMVSKTLAKALETAGFVITTGGLGPTDDDMTNKIVSVALNRSLCLDEDMLKRMEEYAKARGRTLTPSMEKMAWLPEGARVLNPKGLICGCCIEEQGVRLYCLPGVPEQMRYLMDNFVLPELLTLHPDVPTTGTRILRLYGISEPDIAKTIKTISDKIGDVILGFYPHFPENHITLGLAGDDSPSVTEELNRVETQIQDLFNPFVFSKGDPPMEEVVARALLDRGMTISVAESCTGGLIGHQLTNIAGSSAYFFGGFIVYSNQSKIDFVHVRPDTLTTHGAVSEETVREMAARIRDSFKTDLGLAVTGIAGPDGGTSEKPVGTVCIGLATGDEVYSDRYHFWGNRAQIRLETAMMALDWVRRHLNGNTFISGI